MTQTLVADWTWIGAQFARDVAVTWAPDGRISAVGPAADAPPEHRRLSGCALLPAFVNAHSHAFQRALRGRTEHTPLAAGQDDFWSWRARMYQAANALDLDALVDVSRWAFIEMARAGMGTVVEFHYVHHGPGGVIDSDPTRLDQAIARAALDVGLRVTMLRVAYERGGPGAPAELHQRRFVDADVGCFLDRTEALQAGLSDAPLCRVGVAPHSVRAVSAPWLRAIAERASAREWTVHVHASEQPAEIAAAREEHGATPIGILDDSGLLGARTTLVHAIHLEGDDIERIAGRGASVCACPTTEANLGDGVIPADALIAEGVPVALGSDSHAQIDTLADARALENHLRLQRLRRNVLTAPSPSGARSTATRLIECATRSGAIAAGWSDLGTIATGAWADLVSIDLGAPALAGCADDPDALAAALVFAGDARDVRDTWVAGRPVVVGGVHPRQDEGRRRFEAVQTRLWDR